MNRQTIASAITGLLVGMASMSFLKDGQQRNEMSTAIEAVKVTTNVAKQYMDGYYKQRDHYSELFQLAKSYEETKSSEERERIAKSLVFKIRDFNFPVSK